MSRGERFEAAAGAERRRVGGAAQRRAAVYFFWGATPRYDTPMTRLRHRLAGRWTHGSADVRLSGLLALLMLHMYIWHHALNNTHSHRRGCFHCSHFTFRFNLTSGCTSGDQQSVQPEQHCPCLDLMYHWRQTHITVTKTGAFTACHLIIKHQWCNNTDTEWKYSIMHSCCLWDKRSSRLKGREMSSCMFVELRHLLNKSINTFQRSNLTVLVF